MVLYCFSAILVVTNVNKVVAVKISTNAVKRVLESWAAKWSTIVVEAMKTHKAAKKCISVAEKIKMQEAAGGENTIFG